jgi:hypothetical protein
MHRITCIVYLSILSSLLLTPRFLFLLHFLLFAIIHFELVRFYLNVHTIYRRSERSHSKHQSCFVNRIGVHHINVYLTDFFCSLSLTVVFLSHDTTFIYVRLFIRNNGSITRSMFGLNIMPTKMLACFSFYTYIDIYGTYLSWFLHIVLLTNHVPTIDSYC